MSRGGTWAPVFALSLSVVALVVGCSTRSQAGGCPQDLPPACPTEVPSYAATIAPLIGTRCLSCHGDGGVEVSKHDLTSYAEVFKERSSVLDQVYGCAMPPASAHPLTAEERKAFLGWLVCHAPDN